MTTPQDLPVLWTRPEGCICGAVFAHDGGLYRIARTVNPACTNPHLDQHPHGMICSACETGRCHKCDGQAYCADHDALDYCTHEHPERTP